MYKNIIIRFEKKHTKKVKSYLLFPVVTFYGDQDFSPNLIWLQLIFLKNPIVISFALEVLQPAFVRFVRLQVFLFLMSLPHPRALSSENAVVEIFTHITTISQQMF